MSDYNRNKAVIRAHLDGKSTVELTNLLANLLQAADTRMIEVFWEEVAGLRLNTEKLYYGSPELFLAELKQFAKDVEDSKYFDSEIQEQYNEYHYYEHDEDEDGFDADSHQGFRLLKRFLREADCYFQARRYEVICQAYGMLQEVIFGDSYDLLGIGDLPELLELDEKEFVQRYLLSLQQSRAKKTFYEEALSFLAWQSRFESRYLPYFLELVGNEQDALVLYLEEWADQLEARRSPPLLSHAPLHLRLLSRFYIEHKQLEKIPALQHRFRGVYLLGEIANHEGKEREFREFYNDLLANYPRHRALRRELMDKVG